MGLALTQNVVHWASALALYFPEESRFQQPCLSKIKQTLRLYPVSATPAASATSFCAKKKNRRIQTILKTEQKNKHVELAAKYMGAENRKDEEEKNSGLRMSQKREGRHAQFLAAFSALTSREYLSGS